MALDPITGGEELAGKVADLIGKFVPDQAAAAQLQLQVFTLIANANAQQAAITQQYAQSNSFYMAGARPAFLWIGVFYFAYTYVAVPLTMFFAYALGFPIPKPPVLDTGIQEFVALLLGVGAMRTYDKTKLNGGSK